MRIMVGYMIVGAVAGIVFMVIASVLYADWKKKK